MNQVNLALDISYSVCESLRISVRFRMVKHQWTSLAAAYSKSEKQFRQGGCPFVDLTPCETLVALFAEPEESLSFRVVSRALFNYAFRYIYSLKSQRRSNLPHCTYVDIAEASDLNHEFDRFAKQ